RFDIIEISAIRVRGGQAVDTFSSFVRPRYPIEWFITRLTGITDAMVWDAPEPSGVLAAFADFAGEDILMGHNVNFDVNALYDAMETYLGRPLPNDFVDVLRLSRSLLPDLPSHKQVDLAAHFGVDPKGAHRALRDCEICKANFDHLKGMAPPPPPSLEVTVYGEGSDVPAVYLIADQAEGAAVWQALETAQAHLRLIVIPCEDWSRDLSPWPAPAVFGKEDFGGLADSFLGKVEDAVHTAEKDFSPSFRVIAGYSLAGLTALYAPYRTALFDKVVSASGSVWYDGWLDYALRTPFAGAPQAVYLSVGDREKLSRNPRLQGVEEANGALASRYADLGIKTLFELNSGNHFQDVPERLVKGILWALRD
ncbi:MAG: hypothetical protein J5755_01970, partial [Clostridia bacterium]|nr:hypothetical protein [Clostridia bacterium]